MRVVEVVGGVSKRVDFELCQQVLGKFLEKPINDHASLDGTLGMQDEDDLGVLRVVELLLDDPVADSHVCCGVAKVALDKTFDDIE